MSGFVFGSLQSIDQSEWIAAIMIYVGICESYSNIIMVTEKSILFSQYVNYCHTCITTVVSPPHAIIGSDVDFATMIFAYVCLFEHLTFEMTWTAVNADHLNNQQHALK